MRPALCPVRAPLGSRHARGARPAGPHRATVSARRRLTRFSAATRVCRSRALRADHRVPRIPQRGLAACAPPAGEQRHGSRQPRHRDHAAPGRPHPHRAARPLDQERLHAAGCGGGDGAQRGGRMRRRSGWWRRRWSRSASSPARTTRSTNISMRASTGTIREAVAGRARRGGCRRAGCCCSISCSAPAARHRAAARRALRADGRGAAGMGVAYNVPPVRTKDRAYLDVLSESVNNPLRC